MTSLADSDNGETTSPDLGEIIQGAAFTALSPWGDPDDDSWRDDAADQVRDAVLTALQDEGLGDVLEELRMLREVLVFADGVILSQHRRWGEYDFVLADLYAEDTPLQGVIRRAGCHERRKFLDEPGGSNG